MKTTLPKDNPFRVPDGYFDSLTDRIMASLPREEKKPARRLWRWAAAACLAGAIAIGGYYSLRQTTDAPQTASVEQTESDYMDEALDYALVDNQEIAAYLTSNE